MSLEDQCKKLHPYSSLGGSELVINSFNGRNEVEVLTQFRTDYADFPFDNESLILGSTFVLDQLLRENFTLALATNKPRNLVDRCLIAHGLEGYFEKIITPDSVPKKPSPAGLLGLADSVAHDGTPIYVGDSIEDAVAANLAGWKFIHFADNRYTLQHFPLVSQDEQIVGYDKLRINAGCNSESRLSYLSTQLMGSRVFSLKDIMPLIR